MCDFRDGEVLLSVPRFEPYENLVQLWFEHHGEEFGLRILDRMDSLLASRGVPREMQLESPVNLVRVGMPPLAKPVLEPG